MYAKLAVGGVCGLAWATGLRGLMAQVAGQESTVSWIFTFGFILFPGVVVGVLLGWAEYLRTTGGRRGWRWLALSPFLFAIFNPAALGVALLGTAGGFAVSRRGPLWARIACGLFAMAVIPLWALIADAVGGPRIALDTPRGAWIAVYFYSFLAVLALACAIPYRAVVSPSGSPMPEYVDLASREGGEIPSA
jgi:hypothetical protein